VPQCFRSVTDRNNGSSPESRSSEKPSSPGKSNPWSRTFSEYFTPKSEKLCRSASGTRVIEPRTFDETAFLHESSEVLLVKANTHESLHDTLKL
jgi:hypothetical protein